MAADLASNPDVGSSMKIIEGFATSSTAIVNLLRCSVDRPFTPGRPTRAPLKGFSSTRSITSSTKAYEGSTKDKVGKRSTFCTSSKATQKLNFKNTQSRLTL
jgi:hypothetical protein